MESTKEIIMKDCMQKFEDFTQTATVFDLE